MTLHFLASHIYFHDTVLKCCEKHPAVCRRCQTMYLVIQMRSLVTWQKVMKCHEFIRRGKYICAGMSTYPQISTCIVLQGENAVVEHDRMRLRREHLHVSGVWII